MAQPAPAASGVARGLALLLLAAVFLRADGAPVANLDSWADWKYGQWIWEHKALPEHDPFSPYSDPKREVRDASWLAEVGYYLVAARAGPEGLGLLHALLETAKAALFLLAARRATGSPGTAVAATLLMEAACWPFFDAVRTTTPGEVCWAALLLACAGRVPSRADLAAAPVVVALWANLSPTFAFGLVLLGGLLLGRFLQEARARRSLTGAGRDPAVRRLALMLALAAAAACLNPYGTELVKDAFSPDPAAVLPARLWPNLVPVHLWENRAVIASVLVVLVLLRLSPRPFTATEVLLTAAFALWAWYDKRVVPWWLTLAPWLLARHLQATFETARGVGQVSNRPAAWKAAPRWALAVGAAAAAVLVLLSPAARWAAGHPRPAEERVGGTAPYRLAERLRERDAPALRVFNQPFWWGDYLLWRLPPGDSVFWYSRPEGFLQRRGGASPGLNLSAGEWRALVERYRFNALVVWADASDGLSAYLAAAPGEWDVIEDGPPGGGRGLVAVRRTDPFVLSLAGADAAQACVGGFGLAPTAGPWSVLTHLPWVWPAPREQKPESRD
jgi:hypothetical protein